MTRQAPFALLSLVLASALLLASCFGSDPKTEHFYALGGPTAATEKGQGPRLGIADLVPDAGYDSQRIAYRVGPNEIRYYGYRQWVSEPARMLTETATRYFKNSGRFSLVGSADRVRQPDALLGGRLEAIEEIDDKENERSLARLAMTWVMVAESTGEVLLRYGFDVTRPCEKRGPTDVTRVMTTIYREQMLKLVGKVAIHLETRANNRRDVGGPSTGLPKARPAKKATAIESEASTDD